MTSGRTILFLFLAAAQAAAQQPGRAADTFTATAEPCLQVDYPSPTADKPQSKLWYMEGCWWALLPRASGPSLWQRTGGGWKEHTGVAEALRGVPGRADVWPEASGVTAVGVAQLDKKNRAMTVFRLELKGESTEMQWEGRVLAELLPPSPKDAIETATLVRDSEGGAWVAAVAGAKVCVWTSSSDSAAWAGPIILGEGISEDDICVITPLPGNQIGVLWSDQVREGVLMRAHVDGAAPEAWREEEVAAMGNQTADDHLNTALSADGTLWVASKNEVDTAGKAQFVLRERSAKGEWRNWPYGLRQETTRPSRPIVVTAEDGSAVLTGYGDNDRAVPSPHDAKIVFSRVDPGAPERVSAPRAVIFPAKEHHSFVQNVTGPRNPYPMDAPWIVLASDHDGRVYEADLRQAFPDAGAEHPQQSIARPSPQPGGAGEPKQQDLFYQGMGDVPVYRIPALAVTNSGAVIAVCDARADRGQDLPNDIDLVMRRSLDMGETWGASQVIADFGKQGGGDAALLVDRMTGRVWCFFTYAPDGVGVKTSQPGVDGDTFQLHLIHSDDDGVTWSKPRNINPEVKNPEWDAVWSSPGRGCQASDGRLYFPLSRKSGAKVYSHFIYSDDHGAAWHMGGPAGEATNEWMLVQRSSGELLANMRSNGGENRRAVATSPDGGQTWEGFHHHPELIEPVCQACLMGYAYRDERRLLFSNPAATERRRMAVKLSRDEGKTWPVEKVLHDGPAAYSCMAVLPDGQIGILYEHGEDSPYEMITFAKFPLAWLME